MTLQTREMTPMELGDAVEDNDEYRYSDSELAAIIRNEVHNSNTEWTSSVAGQRERAYRAYYGIDKDKPKNRSQHVSMEVFDSVESIKAKMLRTFTANRQVVKFEPLSQQDVQAAEAATIYTNTIFHRKNPGYKILNDAFHDGLLTKQCCIKRYWKEEINRIPESFEDVPAEALDAFLAQPNIELIEITDERTEMIEQATPQGMMNGEQRFVSGEIYRIEDNSHVAIEVVPPEDFFIDGNADDIRHGNFFGQRFEKTESELIEEGFDPEVIKGISHWDVLPLDFEESARHSIDDTYRWKRYQGENERRLIVVYECYIKIDMTGDDIAEWWQIIMGGSDVIHKERVAEVPYETWSPFLLSHKTIGMSIADITIDLQKTISSVIRGWTDNIWITNTTRSVANLSLIKNPRDLIENYIGAVIDSPDPQNAVVPLQNTPLNSSTGTLYELLNQQKEMRTGDTRLAKGMNQDAIAKQNAQDMINDLTNAANERIMIMAKSFAEVCLKPLMRAIYRLGVENGQVVSAEVQGQYQQMNPQGWQMRDNLIVDVALTPEESEVKARALLQMHQLMGADPQMQPIYGIEQKYAVFSRALDLMGCKSPAYLANPQTPQVQQQMQVQIQKSQEMEQMQKQLAGMQVQLQTFSEETKRLRVMLDAENKQERLDLDTQKAADEQALNEREFEHDKKMDYAEVAIEATQKRPASI